MLNDFQTNLVWENMLAAETRSLYFGDLATRYTRRKQWITGGSFFLSSGAAASVIVKSPEIVPIILALAVALATAYAMAINLDGRIGTMAKLHASWNSIAADYSRLWSHAYADDSEKELEEIVKRARESSELATTDAPNDPKLMDKWESYVFAMHHLTGQNG
jgi:hypothetical protein